MTRTLAFSLTMLFMAVVFTTRDRLEPPQPPLLSAALTDARPADDLADVLKAALDEARTLAGRVEATASVPAALYDRLARLLDDAQQLRRRTATLRSPGPAVLDRLDELERLLETAHYQASPTYAGFAHAAIVRLDTLSRDLVWLEEQIAVLTVDARRPHAQRLAALEETYAELWTDLGAAPETLATARDLGPRLAVLARDVQQARRAVQRLLATPGGSSWRA